MTNSIVYCPFDDANGRPATLDVPAEATSQLIGYAGQRSALVTTIRVLGDKQRRYTLAGMLMADCPITYLTMAARWANEADIITKADEGVMVRHSVWVKDILQVIHNTLEQ